MLDGGIDVVMVVTTISVTVVMSTISVDTGYGAVLVEAV
jgi:hypothetical protein